MHFASPARPLPGRSLEPTVARPAYRPARPPHAGPPAASAVAPALLALAAGLLGPVPGHAAGGHHAVDDASILEAGQCQLETWAERGSGYQLQHVGPACRLAGIELGLNLDRYALRGDAALRTAGPQLKWARELQPGLSWGVIWSATWQSASPRLAGQALLLPVTWSPREDLSVHVNIGRDFHRRAPDHGRYGLAVEWQPHPRWQGVVEHWDDGLRQRNRLGMRFLVSESLSADLSRAQARGQPREAWWSLGLNYVFAR